MASIDLPQLALLVTAGLSVVLAAIHLTGGSVRATFGSEAQVLEIWRVDHPVGVDHVQISDDGTAALLHLTDGTLGVVFSLGDRWVTRRVSASARVRERPPYLIVDLSEVTTPALRIQLGNAGVRARWQRQLEA